MKLLILSNFTFSHNVLLELFSSVCKNDYIWRKGLKIVKFVPLVRQGCLRRLTCIDTFMLGRAAHAGWHVLIHLCQAGLPMQADMYWYVLCQAGLPMKADMYRYIYVRQGCLCRLTCIDMFMSGMATYAGWRVSIRLCQARLPAQADVYRYAYVRQGWLCRLTCIYTFTKCIANFLTPFLHDKF